MRNEMESATRGKTLQKIKTILLIVVFLVAIIFPPLRAKATVLDTLSDVMTRLQATTLSSHDITIGLSAANTFAAGETIIIDFQDDLDYFDVGAGTTTADLDFNDGVEDKVIFNVGAATDCTGSVGEDDISVGVDETDGDVTFLACPSYVASAANANINIEYGTAAGGTNRVTNGAAATRLIGVDETTDDASTIAVVIIADDTVDVSTTIDPYVTFTITTTTVSLTKSGGGNPDYSNVGFNNGAANTLAATTNGVTGYNITYNGATLTSGGNTITAIGGTPAASTAGIEQFGLNLKDNAAPNTGAEPSGDNEGVPEADYATADSFAYETTGAIPLANSSNSPAETTTFTVSYIVNVDEETESGAYQTSITYICTGNF